MMLALGELRCQSPGWCDWMPFADYFAACKPLTQVEMDACDRASFGREMPPERIEESIERGRQTAADYCRLHPDECERWRASTDCPTIAATLGPAAAAAICGETGLLPSGKLWLYLLGGGLVLALLLRR